MPQDFLPVLVVFFLLFLDLRDEDALLLNRLHMLCHLVQPFLKACEVGEPMGVAAKVVINDDESKFAVQRERFCKGQDQILAHAIGQLDLARKLVLQVGNIVPELVDILCPCEEAEAEAKLSRELLL